MPLQENGEGMWHPGLAFCYLAHSRFSAAWKLGMPPTWSGGSWVGLMRNGGRRRDWAKEGLLGATRGNPPSWGRKGANSSPGLALSTKSVRTRGRWRSPLLLRLVWILASSPDSSHCQNSRSQSSDPFLIPQAGQTTGFRDAVIQPCWASGPSCAEGSPDALLRGFGASPCLWQPAVEP